MKTIKRKYVSIIALVFALLVYLVAPVTKIMALADTDTPVDFSKTSVTDDLKSLTEINDFKFLESGVCYFVEYGYSPIVELRNKYFGLYVYFYNPLKLNINTSSIQNEVTLSYTCNEQGQFDNYDSYRLIFCNKSDDNKFYKFKIDLAYNDNFINSKGERKYACGEIELVKNGDLTATTYKFGGVYTFTGTAKGFGVDENAESSLTQTKADLQTLELEVQSTYYRPKATNENGNQSQVTSVYFAVPNDILTKYGTLQRIKAEWFEYKTKPIMVANNSQETHQGMTCYDFLYPLINKDVSTLNFAETFPNLTNIQGISLYGQIGSGDGSDEPLIFPYLFGTSNIEEYDPLAKTVEEIGGISGNELYQYILQNKSNLTGESLDIKNGQILKAYFEDDIDETRKRNDEFGVIQQGYSFYDFDASANLGEITKYNPHDNNWGENIANYGFWGSLYWNLPDSTKANVEPITVLKSDVFKTGLSDSEKNELVDDFFINPLHFDKIVSDVQKNAMDSKTTFKFNFAVSEYSCEIMNLVTYNNFYTTYENMAYVAQESVFFDFDIIQLTFKGENKNLTVIPVVANPIDIVPDITPPVIINDDEDWWKKPLAIILFILLLIFLATVFSPFLPYILNVLVAIIVFPFKAVSNLTKKIKKK